MKNPIIDGKVTVSSKGQVVIPKELRDAVGIRAGNELLFKARKDGIIEIIPLKQSIEMFFGRCKKSGEKAISIKDMDKAIMQAVTESSEEEE